MLLQSSFANESPDLLHRVWYSGTSDQVPTRHRDGAHEFQTPSTPHYSSIPTIVHRRYGTPEGIPLDWTSFMVKKRAELERLHGVYNNMLKNSGCDMHEGRATIVDPHTVEVAGKRFTVRLPYDALPSKVSALICHLRELGSLSMVSSHIGGHMHTEWQYTVPGAGSPAGA